MHLCMSYRAQEMHQSNATLWMERQYTLLIYVGINILYDKGLTKMFVLL